MKVVGFSFIRNAEIYDYPIREAILSVLPLCDHFVVAVGKSDDQTLELVQSIHPEKIQVIQTEWDDTLRAGGRVLALETDKAYRAIPEDADWAFYIQGDEVLHEMDHQAVLEAMLKWKDHQEVEGLLFKYKHFYASYAYLDCSPNRYTREIRVIRKRPDIFSYRDAQGFRKIKNQKLQVKPVEASIYHYGWVKPPAAMQKKEESFHRYWHDDQWMQKHIEIKEQYNYGSNVKLLPFEGSHPAVMNPRIQSMDWKFIYDNKSTRLSFRYRLKQLIRDWLDLDFSYKNYRKI